VAGELRARDTAARAREPCIGAGRADLVVAGAAIVQALYARFPFTALRVADRGLREGILAGLMGERLETALTRQLGPPSGASVA
jgi:exopolyphosphatase/guanosine-5'-triphosphate,3'-diphosphate pyrophosphatase